MRFNREILRLGAAALAISAALGAAPAAAGEHMPNGKFDALDRNQDGMLSLDEVKGLRGYAAAFDAADANRDGKLNRNEFTEAEAIHDRIVAGKYVDDSVLTARVKAALLEEPDLKSLDVSVETQDGVVLLSGFVRDESQRYKAFKAASMVSGVASVKNAMVVR
jgi:hyperosmotically inducible protein